jgi:hypothetical protein
MSAPQPPQPPQTREAGVLARAALSLYPPAWRARYGDEVRALLDDSGAGLRDAASLAWRAVPAWAWPPRHLHDVSGRMRSSLATAGMAWALLAGLSAVFVQLVVLAARAAVLAAVTMGLACAASVVAAVGLYLWAPADAGYHESWQLALYLPAVLLASAVAVASAARGIRAARPPAAA